MEIRLWIILSLITLTLAYPISLPGCPNTCGGVAIPYPFGTKTGCYLNDEFHISCNTSYDPPKPFLPGGNINVTEIMLSVSQLRVLVRVAHLCYTRNGALDPTKSDEGLRLATSKFPISYSKNKFTVLGCDAYAFFYGNAGPTFQTGCLSVCNRFQDVVNGSCSGIGCCQTSIPRGIMGIMTALLSFNNNTIVYGFDRCNYAFVVEETAYQFNSLDFVRLAKVPKLPVILDWTIGNRTCDEARRDSTSFACKVNSFCYDSDNGSGYRCNCSRGFEGNPYLPNGCQDIDECKVIQPCNMTCQNLIGSYECLCSVGYKGDGKKEGSGCSLVINPSSDKKLLITALVSSLSISLLLMASGWLYCGLQRRKLMNLRRRHFKQNGGVILQELLSHHGRLIETFKHYTESDLVKATNNYNDDMVLGQGGQGVVYKGVLPCSTIVAIKKSTNTIDKSQIKDFINELVILSQINHRNVVKVFGCCLETEVPVLVYEFIPNGTLFDLIHRSYNTPKMPWNTRLRIALEVAQALSYLHSSASVPIIHRDVKTSNILLDESYTAKVSDFGISRFVPKDRSSLTTLVQGTFGYLDPEYFYSSQLTEKSDVYSFGVVLVELMTGEKAVCFDREENIRSLALYFVSSVEEDKLFRIVEGSLKMEANARQISQVATMAARCLRVKGEDRPSMKEVASQLEALLKMKMLKT